MASPLSAQEKTLYHQIHPLKLLTDWGSGIIALFFFWAHKIILALAIAVIPSFLVSFALLQWADLARLKDSAFGNYVHQYMTLWAQLARLLGYAIMAAGAWFHQAWLIVVGLLVIVSAWMWGIFTKNIT